MSTRHSTRWESLRRWRSAMFLAAGPLVVIAMRREWVAGNSGLPEPVFWSLLPLGFAAALLGLVGVATELDDASSRQVRVGRGVGLFGAAALLVGLGVLAVLRPPGPYPSSLGPIGLPFLLGFLAFIVTAAAVGAAAWRTDTPSRTVGALVVGLAVVQFAEKVFALVLVPVYGLSREVIVAYQFGLYGVPMVLGMLAVGYVLRDEDGIGTPTDPPDQPA